MDAVQRKQRRQPLFEKNRPGMKFKFSLQKGDIVKIIRDGKEYLGIIRAFSAEARIEYCSITDARTKKDIDAANEWYRPRISTYFKQKMQKYNMNIFGELQTAND